MMPSRKMLAAQISRALHAPRACSCLGPPLPVIKRFLFLQLAHLRSSRGQLAGPLTEGTAAVGRELRLQNTRPASHRVGSRRR
jgi:hypothetical protein